jgi:di/tricarboxylate transporter
VTLDIALVLSIIFLSLVLFSIERIPTDVVAIGVVIALTVTGVISPAEAFAGFGSDAVVMIFGLLVLTAALLRTGVVFVAGREILRRVGESHSSLMTVIMVASASIGAFMSNTASTAFFVPVVIGIARKARVSASRFLMPLAFSSILSSSVTLVSTSTNIIVSDLMTRSGMKPMGMFELAPVGVPITVLGLAYMAVIGKRLIPDRAKAKDGDDNLVSQTYLTEIVILPGSQLSGKSLAESRLGTDMDLTVVRVIRDKNRYLTPQADLELKAGDVLLVEGDRDEILTIKNTGGIDIKADVKLSDSRLQSGDVRLAEAILLTRSPLIGRTLKGFRFRERYGLQVLAINQHGQNIQRKISQIRFRMGDMLLIQGQQSNINALEEEGAFRVVRSLEGKLPNLRRAPIAIAAFVGAILLATFRIVSLPVATTIGVLVVFLTRCITPEEAYRDVEWKALILIGCMLALGQAMEQTGTAAYLADLITHLTVGLSPIWLLAVFFLLTVFLTLPMSHQAATVVVVPVAMQTALQLGLNPRTFAMMIAIAASCSYLTPLEPSCLMVYGPGRYRFSDFLKVGSLLTLMILLIALVLVPLIWPLHSV